MGRALLVMEGIMICKYRLPDGNCYNAEEKTMCMNYPSERYCQVMCDFREVDKEEEAVKLLLEHKQWLEEWPRINGTGRTQKLIEALQIGADALEKQIPKKPKKVLCADNKTYAHHCPNCGAWITRTITFENKFDAEKVNANGCYACLQRIDWSDEE